MFDSNILSYDAAMFVGVLDFGMSNSNSGLVMHQNRGSGVNIVSASVKFDSLEVNSREIIRYKTQNFSMEQRPGNTSLIEDWRIMH